MSFRATLNLLIQPDFAVKGCEYTWFDYFRDFIKLACYVPQSEATARSSAPLVGTVLLVLPDAADKTKGHRAVYNCTGPLAVLQLDRPALLPFRLLRFIVPL